MLDDDCHLIPFCQTHHDIQTAHLLNCPCLRINGQWSANGREKHLTTEFNQIMQRNGRTNTYAAKGPNILIRGPKVVPRAMMIPWPRASWQFPTS